MNIFMRFKLRWLLEGVKTVIIFKSWPKILWSHLFTDNKCMRVKLRDGAEFKIRRNRKDAKVIREVYVEKIYHKYIGLLRDGAIVIDIGGNIGAFTILAARYNRSIRVYSYEPFEANYFLLKDNVIINGLENQIYPSNYAVGRAKEERVIVSNGTDSMSNLYGSEGEQVTISAVSLRDVFVDNDIQKCDFLKVDCEGSEYEIFYSTPQEIYDRIKTISLEFHERFGTGKGKDLKAFLETKGFRCLMKGKAVGYIYAEKT